MTSFGPQDIHRWFVYLTQTISTSNTGVDCIASRLGYKTCVSKTETKTSKNGCQDVWRPRLKSWELQVCCTRFTN